MFLKIIIVLFILSKYRKCFETVQLKNHNKYWNPLKGLQNVADVSNIVTNTDHCLKNTKMMTDFAHKGVG